jgi:hypothetical protein
MRSIAHNTRQTAQHEIRWHSGSSERTGCNMQPSSEEHSADQTAMAQSNAKGHSLNRNGSQRYRSDDSSAEPTSQSTVRTRAGGGSARHRPAAARARALRRRTATRGGALTRAATPATVKSSQQRKGHRQRISSTGRSSTQSSTRVLSYTVRHGHCGVTHLPGAEDSASHSAQCSCALRRWHANRQATACQTRRVTLHMMGFGLGL